MADQGRAYHPCRPVHVPMTREELIATELLKPSAEGTEAALVQRAQVAVDELVGCQVGPETERPLQLVAERVGGVPSGYGGAVPPENDTAAGRGRPCAS